MVGGVFVDDEIGLLGITDNNGVKHCVGCGGEGWLPEPSGTCGCGKLGSGINGGRLGRGGKLKPGSDDDGDGGAPGVAGGPGIGSNGGKKSGMGNGRPGMISGNEKPGKAGCCCDGGAPEEPPADGGADPGKPGAPGKGNIVNGNGNWKPGMLGKPGNGGAPGKPGNPGNDGSCCAPPFAVVKVLDDCSAIASWPNPWTLAAAAGCSVAATTTAKAKKKAGSLDGAIVCIRIGRLDTFGGMQSNVVLTTIYRAPSLRPSCGDLEFERSCN
ncbi:hypothetical protein ABZP36_015002 [Zizania latifolia]